MAEFAGRCGCFVADHSDHFDRLGGRQFVDRQHQALRGTQPQQGGKRVGRGWTTRAAGGRVSLRNDGGDPFTDRARQIGFDHDLSRSRVLQPADHHFLEL